MSLLGKADPTLVKGAYAVAQADVPGDMSQVYKDREANIKALTKGIQAAWDSQFEAYNAYETRMVEKSDVAIANVLEGKANDSMLAAVDEEVRAIKAVMKTFDKKDKGNLEWKKLEARVGKLVTTTKNNDAIWSSLIDLSKNGDLHVVGQGKELDLYEALMDDYNNNTNFTGGKIVNGDFVYSLPSDPSITMTMTELKNKLKIKDATAPNGIMSIINNVEKSAAQSDRAWDNVYIADTKNAIRNNLKSANDRTNVIHHRFPGMEFSIWETLTNPEKNPELTGDIHDALMGLRTDIDGDGNIDDALTYTDVDNAVLLQKYLINNANSKDLIADFLTENIGKNSYGLGEDVRKKTKSKNRSSSSSGSVIDDPPKRPKNFTIPFVGPDNKKFTMKSDDVYNLQDRMTSIMNSGRQNQTINIRNQEYIWGGKGAGWVKATWDPKRNKYTWKAGPTGKPVRSFKTIQKVFDQHGIIFQGSGGTTTSGKPTIQF